MELGRRRLHQVGGTIFTTREEVRMQSGCRPNLDLEVEEVKCKSEEKSIISKMYKVGYADVY